VSEGLSSVTAASPITKRVSSLYLCYFLAFLKMRKGQQTHEQNDLALPLSLPDKQPLDSSCASFCFVLQYLGALLAPVWHRSEKFSPIGDEKAGSRARRC
jgi:hypothetical protein